MSERADFLAEENRREKAFRDEIRRPLEEFVDLLDLSGDRHPSHSLSYEGLLREAHRLIGDEIEGLTPREQEP